MTEERSRVEVGHVHGRFQPFHIEHLAYVAWAARHAERIVVGITNADPSHVLPEEADEKRHVPRHNPFTYHERHRMVRDAISDSDVDVARVSVMPFPINRPELWDVYAPRRAVHFINVLEPWHEVKAERLRENGRAVRTKRGKRSVSGTSIRERMANGRPWRDAVPPAVATVIDDIDGENRLRELFLDAS